MRKYVLIAALAAVVLGVTACGNSNSGDDKLNSTTEVKTTADITTAEEGSEITTEEVTTEVLTKEQSSQKVVKKKMKKKTDNSVPKMISDPAEAKAAAQDYIGKTIDELVKAVGEYDRMEKSKSCLDEGEFDGMFYYNGFIVSASTKNGEWIISSVD